MINQRKKNVSLKLISAACALAVFLPTAGAQAADRKTNRDRFTVYAKVIQAEPIYRQVVLKEPVQQCWTEQQRYVVNEGHSYRPNYRGRGHKYNSRTNGNAIVGGVIGGVIGNQIGRNANSGARAGATIAGAIIGSAIANDVNGNRGHRRDRHYNNDRHYNDHSYQQSPTYGVRPVKRCKTVVNNRYEQRIDGYNVTYIHRGRRFQTRTRKDPGARIQLNVNVQPARNY